MRLIPRALVAVSAAAGLALAGVAPAVAAPAPQAVASAAVFKVAAAKPVTLKTIPTKTVKGNSKAVVKPSFSQLRGVSKIKPVITVKKGSKTLVASKPVAKLGVGTYKVTSKVSYVYKGKAGSVSKTQTLVVKKAAAAKKPSSVGPSSGWNCPKSHPIKGNASSMIYHVPGGQYYSRTNPEECFASAAAARAKGYRASKR